MNGTILILGGDGYLGWPLAMRMSLEHPDLKIIILDNEWRRNITGELGYKSAVPIAIPSARLDAFRAVHGLSNLMYIKANINAARLEELIRVERPIVIYHLAHQPSAPYSMKGTEESIFTMQNNEAGNLRLLWAVKKYSPATHIVKMGSFGTYAKSGVDIPEGYFSLSHNGRTAEKELLFPMEADDVYHISKINDSNYISMACRKWNLRVTDVMQSVICGNLTPEMRGNSELYTRFDYDDVFGTVLNRFLAQVVSGEAITVFGSGEQRTGLMPLPDVVHSLVRFVHDIPESGTHRVINHITEKEYTINMLAHEVQSIAKELGYIVHINREFDPRDESEKGRVDYNIDTHYIDKYITPTPIAKIIKETLLLLAKYKDAIEKRSFSPRIRWASRKDHIISIEDEISAKETFTPGTTDSKYWEAFRRIYFPSSRINLNTGTLGTTSMPVINVRSYDSHTGLEAYPLGTYADARRKHDEVILLCNELWPAEWYTVAITPSVTQTVNILALGMLRALSRNLQPPFKVLTTCHEHKGGIGVFANLPEYELHFIHDKDLNKEGLRAVVQELQPDIVFISHVFYDTCRLNPVDEWAMTIKEICNDAVIIIDVAQSLGLYPLPAGSADVIVSSTHKWLYGPHGGGLMWATDCFIKLIGGLYWTLDPAKNTEDERPGFIIPGGQDFQLHAAILECLRLYQQVGTGVVLERSVFLCTLLSRRLAGIFAAHSIKFTFLSEEDSTPALSIAFPDYDVYKLYSYLNERNIHVKCIINHAIQGVVYNVLRFSVPYFETENRLLHAANEIDYFLSQQTY